MVAQGPVAGALPTLHAATEVAGAPRPVGSSAASHDRVVARALWDRASS